MTKKILGILLTSLLAIGPIVLTGCGSSKPSTLSGGSLARLTLGTNSSDLSALIWIAKGQGYFLEQGLDVDFKFYESGLASTKDLLAGDLDLATATEYVAASHIFQRPDLRIIAILDYTHDTQFVARRDHGITREWDIKNKRIGLLRSSAAEFYLHRGLILHKTLPQDVQLVDLPPSEQVKAIAKGDVDAVMTWEPFATRARDELGPKAVSWPGQNGQDQYWLLVSTDEVIRKKVSAINRFLAALASAERFIEKHETEAEQQLSRLLEANHVGFSWKNHRFKLGMDRSLILAMEAQIRWMKSKSLVPQSDEVDLLDFIYFDALQATKPEGITMAR